MTKKEKPKKDYRCPHCNESINPHKIIYNETLGKKPKIDSERAREIVNKRWQRERNRTSIFGT